MRACNHFTRIDSKLGIVLRVATAQTQACPPPFFWELILHLEVSCSKDLCVVVSVDSRNSTQTFVSFSRKEFPSTLCKKFPLREDNGVDVGLFTSDRSFGVLF